MTDSESAPKRPWPIFGEPLPAGQHYPPPRTDEELFESEHDKQLLMAEYGITEQQARFIRSLGFA